MSSKICIKVDPVRICAVQHLTLLFEAHIYDIIDCIVGVVCNLVTINNVAPPHVKIGGGQR